MPTNKKPIYVPNPNDPRIRAYNDSLNTYNNTNNYYKEMRKLKDNQFKSNSEVDIFTDKVLKKYPVNTKILKIKPLNKNTLVKTIKTGTGTYDIYEEATATKPKQPYVYQKVEEKKKKEKKPISTTDRRKVQAYNDSSFIKKNFNIFPKPKGYDQTLKRVGQDPSADYFPAPEQPYILKKEKKKIKKDIVSVPVKESIPKDTIPIIEPVVKPQVEKEPEPIVPKKLPGGSGPFARYPNMKGQLSNVKTSRMVNARKVENIVPTFVSGAKSVKQYRGDENLPEAKNGMKKGCGCKHSRSKYKYQDGTNDVESSKNIIPVNDRKKKIKDFIADRILLDRYKNISSNTSFNMYEDDEEVETPTSLKNKSVKMDKVTKAPKDKSKLPKRTGVAATKHSFKFFKEGTSALTIPEGSAIVTANKGKNKQALMAYKKGNYKLLNNIIDDMPEDNVDKAQAGRQSLEARYKELGELTGPLSPAQQKEFDDVKSQLTEDEYDIYDDKRIAEKFGQKYDVDKAKWKSSLKGGKLNLKEDTANANYRESLRDPKVLKAAIAAGNVKVDAKGNISYTSVGESAPGKQEFLGTTKKGTLPTLQGSEDLKKGPPPSTVPPDKKKPDNNRKGFDIPSLAEVAARSSILGQGVEGVPENYLKLGRYNYASQLDRTLRENAVAANTAKENIRDVSGGSAGSYLSNVANITGKRFDANAGAVTEDTLARQDILNKNVDLGNVEAQVNTGLKNQFATQRSANRGAYNNQLIALGQGIDTAADASKLMSSQKDADAQRLQILRDAAESGNYQWKQEGNVSSLVPKKKGAKRLKTYKRK